MGYPKQIREQLGFSQSQLAVLLGISESLLALAETGKRTLPSGHGQILTQLAGIAPRVPVFDPEENSQIDKSIQIQVAKKIRLCTLERDKNQERLKALLEKIGSLKRTAWLAEQPETQTLWPKDSIEHDEWHLLLRKNNKKFLALTKEIIFLKISISGLEAEIKTAEKQINA